MAKKSKKKTKAAPQSPEHAEQVEKRPKIWLWIIVAIIVVVLANGALTVYLTRHVLGTQVSSAISEAVNKLPQVISKSKQQHAQKKSQDALFYAFKHSFVVNIKGERRSRFLQIKIKLLTHQKAVISAVEKYGPIIRSELLMLLRNQSYKSLSADGAERHLQQQIRNRINRVLRNKTGNGGVEGVYFTNFVMQ